jgi:hypothetical protein
MDEDDAEMITENNSQKEGIIFTINYMVLRSISVTSEINAHIEKFEGRKARRRAETSYPWIRESLNEWGKEIKKLALPMAVAGNCVLCGMPLDRGLVAINDVINPYGIDVDICEGCELPYISEFIPVIKNLHGSGMAGLVFYPKYPMTIVPNTALDLIREWLIAYNTTASLMTEIHPQWDSYVKLLQDIRKGLQIKEIINGDYSSLNGETKDTGNSTEMELAHNAVVNKTTENSVVVGSVLEAVAG